MSRNRQETLQFRPAVVALAAAIETRGAAALAQGQLDESAVEITMRRRTVHVFLAHELGQSAEAVRRELRRYATGNRMCGAPKCLRLVEAASKLGWIPADARGTGAEEWVRWCRIESERLDRQKAETSARSRQRRRGALEDRVQDLVSFLFQSSLAGEHAEDAARLLDVVVEATLATLLRSEQYWQPNAEETIRRASSSIQRRLRVAKGEIQLRCRLQRDYDKVAMADLLEKLSEQEDVFQRLEREKRASLPAVLASQVSPSDFSAQALRLGIGRDQLHRILACLETGEGLSEDDSKRRRELIRVYAELAGVKGYWPFVLRPFQAGELSTKRARTWAEVKVALEARRTKRNAPALSANKPVKRKVAGSKRSG
ncbi:hypothetical protein [Methylibium sp.]|uniref:hypothetical protein n=1 Tax=Methylibium sp. TaxID=2067992 RepID=UPI001799E1BF|nr:hypothetical protein [Methylibium sp.]MBA3590221.1 hypothetical protein [Methylibium sp.]